MPLVVPAKGVSASLIVSCMFAGFVKGQAQETLPRFESADIHPSVRTSNRYTQGLAGGLMNGGIYQLRRATMLDLIRFAYETPAESVVGGPSWLETEKYDLIAKLPPEAKSAAVHPMLRSLLAERFNLSVHEDSRPFPAFVIVAGREHHMKSSDAGVTQPGSCKSAIQASGESGATPRVSVDCHDVTMDSFVNQLPQFPGADQYIGSTRVLNKTALGGRWSFNFWYNLRAQTSEAGVSVLTIGDALAKQVGLRMETGAAPMRALVVDSVNARPSGTNSDRQVRRPSPALNFEVAIIKPTNPDMQNQRFQVLPGGRVEIDSMTLKSLIQYFWGLRDDMVLGLPDFAESDRWSLVAKAPAMGAIAEGDSGLNADLAVDFDTLVDMLKALIVDRFGLKFHYEERPVATYRMVAAKPKLRQAEAGERSTCREGTISLTKSDARDATPVLGRLLSCLNTTMAQFADMLQFVAPGYVHTSVANSTGLQAGWDFTLSFSRVELVRPDESESDPNGAVSLPQAMERQLGIKMEPIRLPVPVMIVDGITRNPTDN